METPSPHSSHQNTEVRMSFPGHLQPLERAPSHTVASTQAEVGFIPGIENGPREAMAFAFLGAIAVGAIGARAWWQDRSHRRAARAPGFIEHQTINRSTGAAVFDEKRDGKAARAYRTNPYADPRAYVESFRGAHMTPKLKGHRVPDAPQVDPAGNVIKPHPGQSTSTYRVGTAPRELSFYQDRRMQEREEERIWRIGELERRKDPNYEPQDFHPIAARQPSAMEKNRIHRRVRKGQAVLGRERNVLNPLLEKYGRFILDHEMQEAYIEHHGITGQEAKKIRKAGRKARAVTTRNADTDRRMRGLHRR